MNHNDRDDDTEFLEYHATPAELAAMRATPDDVGADVGDDPNYESMSDFEPRTLGYYALTRAIR